MLIDCGYNTNLIADMRKGKIPSADKILRIAKYLEVSVEYLMGNADDATPSDQPEENYIFIVGSGGVRKKYPVPHEKLERFKKLIEAGMPELLDDEDNSDL